MRPHDVIILVIPAEMGSMFLLNGIFYDSEPAKIAISLFFMVSIAWTYFIYRKALKAFRENEGALAVAG